MLGKLFKRLKKGQVGYEESKDLARNKNVKVRAKLASDTSVRPEVLYYLTDDDDSDFSNPEVNPLSERGYQTQLLNKTSIHYLQKM